MLNSYCTPGAGDNCFFKFVFIGLKLNLGINAQCLDRSDSLTLLAYQDGFALLVCFIPLIASPSHAPKPTVKRAGMIQVTLHLGANDECVVLGVVLVWLILRIDDLCTSNSPLPVIPLIVLSQILRGVRVERDGYHHSFRLEQSVHFTDKTLTYLITAMLTSKSINQTLVQYVPEDTLRHQLNCY